MTEKNSNQKTPEAKTRNLVANTIRGKLDALAKEVKERRHLEKECLDALRNETRATVIELDGVMRWTLGRDPVIEKRRLALEDRLWGIRKEVRDQKVNFWRDTQT